MDTKNMSWGIVMLLAATLSWGGMFPIAKPALEIIDPYYITLIRYGIAAVLFVAILWFVEGKQAFRLNNRLLPLLFLGTLGFAGFNLLAFTGLTHSKPEHGAVIIAMMPMITVLLSWFLKGHKPHTFTLVTIIAAFLGVFLVITSGHPQQAFAGGKLEWDLLFLSGAICWVAYTMGAERFPDWSPLRYTTITCVLGAIAIGIITFVLTMNHDIHTPTLATLGELHWTIAYLVIMGALIAVLSWNAGIKLLGPVNGVLFINFVPITAFTIGVINGRLFSHAEILGAAIVITALISNNLFLRYRQQMTLVKS